LDLPNLRELKELHEQQDSIEDIPNL